MISPRERFHNVLKQPLFEILNRFRVVLLRVQLFILALHDLTEVQEGAHVESRVIFPSLNVDQFLNLR